MTIVDLGIGDYDDIVELGRGSFSTVFQGRQRSFDRPVAIKVFSTPGGPDGQKRFTRECEAIGRLSGHPGIVTVYDAATDDDGRCYLIMELLTGGSLAELLAGADRLDVARVLQIGVALAGSLESAHRAGVVHGDVKPENVLLSRFGYPKLADFGLARIQDDAPESTGVAGTLAYAAPEIVAGASPSPAADIYALAATLHTLLAGRPPFPQAGGDSIAAVAARVVTESPEDLRPRGVPDALCQILQQGMTRDPAARQGSMAQLGRQLQAVQARAGHPITPLVVETDASPGTPVRPAGGARRGRPWSRWCRLGGAVVLVAGLFGLAAGQPPAASVRLEPLYQDDFEAGQGWHEQDDAVAAVAYDGGRYRMRVKQPGQQFLSDTAFRGPVYGRPMTGLRDVSVRVTARPESRTGLFGIVCRQAAGRASFYEGLVGVDGSSRIVKYEGGRMVTLTQTSIPIPPPGQALRLRLDCAGDREATRLRLFVDGRSVADIVDRQGLGPGSTGLAAATAEADSATVAFDDFVILGRQSDIR